jgi:transcriptional regulator with XRE-family HTH domain
MVDIDKSVAQLTEGLGRLLHRYRSENNLTRSQLAEKLSVSESRIKQLETGENAQSFKIDFLLSAASVLRLSPPDLLSQLIFESKIPKNSKTVATLEDAFVTSIQDMPFADVLKEALSKNDELFGNHFVWGLKMAGMLLELDEQAKVKVEIALRRASPHKSTEEYRARILRLLDFDLDH